MCTEDNVAICMFQALLEANRYLIKHLDVCGLSPPKASDIPELKYVGYCNFPIFGHPHSLLLSLNNYDKQVLPQRNCTKRCKQKWKQ